MHRPPPPPADPTAPQELFVYKTQAEPWGYLWLKALTAVDLSQHCLAGLIGPRPTVDPAAPFQRVVCNEPTARAYYLCGVSSPYRWSKNGHLLCVPAPGEEHEYEAVGMEVVLSNLRPVPEALEEHFIDWDLPQARDRLFHTCRNWRAANWAVRELGLRNMPNPERQRWASRRGKDAADHERRNPTLL